MSIGWRVLPRRGGEDPAARLDLTGVGLVAAIVAGLYFATLLLVGLLPKHAQQAQQSHG